VSTPSETAVCNRALAAIGTRSTITSMAEASQEARNCLMLYTPTRDMLLRSAHWNFARKTAQLTLLKAAPGTPEFTDPTVSATWIPSYPSPPWLYEYAYPADCLKARFIVPSIITGWIGPVPITTAPIGGSPLANYTGPYARFLIGTSQDGAGNQRTVVLTNQAQAILVYTGGIENPDLWDPQFQEAVVAALASRLVMPLSGDKAQKKLQEQIAMGYVNSARVTDGNEGPQTTNTTPDWILARGGWDATFLQPGYVQLGWDQPYFAGV
jgi:hypothetical protein